MEEWKKIIIEGQPTLYSVSNLGHIRNDKTYTLLSGYINNKGYRMVHLRNRINKMCSVHRLVMKAFKPNPDEDDLQINHIDGNKDNNCLENLEWCTALENIRHSFNHHLQKREMLPCHVYDLDGNYITSFINAGEAEKNGYGELSSINRCLNEENAHYKTYQFKTYKKEKIEPWYNPHAQTEVYVYCSDGTFYKHYKDVSSCSKEFGVEKSSIYRYINGTRKNPEGFIFSKQPL